MATVLVRLGLGIPLALSSLIAACGWISSGRAIHPPKVGSTVTLGDYPELVSKSVTVDSRTGVRMSARFFSGASPATVILTHGYGGSLDEMLPVAAMLHDAGLSVFTYDSRGSGASTGEVTFGAAEQKDLISVLDYVESRPDVDKHRIAAMGFSMGASTTLLAAAQDTRIAAVVSDSGWSEASHWLRPSLLAAFRRPIAPFSSLSLRIAGWRTGTDVRALRPIAGVSRISPRPILFISDRSDQVVPPTDSEQMFAAAHDPKELWLLEGKGHGSTIRRPSPEYRDRVVAFIRRALATSGPHARNFGGPDVGDAQVVVAAVAGGR